MPYTSNSLDPTGYTTALIRYLHSGVPRYRVRIADASGPKAFSSLHSRHPALHASNVSRISSILNVFRLCFFYHCLTIAIDPETRIRPGVRPFQDCWVGVADDIIGTDPKLSGCHLERLALGLRICSDDDHTVLLAFRYAENLDDTNLRDAGLIALPTRNILMSRFLDEDPTTATGINTSLYRRLRLSIPSSSHKAVQLTFSPAQFPPSTDAELIWNIEDCNAEVGYCRWWMTTYHSASEGLTEGGHGVGYAGVHGADGVDAVSKEADDKAVMVKQPFTRAQL